MQDAWSGRTSATASPQPERRVCRAPGLLPTPRRQTRRLTLHGADAWRPLRERSPRRQPGAPGLTAGGRLSPAHPPPPGRLLPLLLLLPPVGRRSAHDALSRPRPLSPPPGQAATRRCWAYPGTAARTARAGTWRKHSPHALLVGRRPAPPLWTTAGHIYHVIREPTGRADRSQTPVLPASLATAAREQKRPASPSRHRSGAQPRRTSLMRSPQGLPRASGPGPPHHPPVIPPGPRIPLGRDPSHSPSQPQCCATQAQQGINASAR